MAGKKGLSPSVYKYYKIDGEKLSKTHKICSRCGKGVFHVRTQRQKNVRKMRSNRIFSIKPFFS